MDIKKWHEDLPLPPDKSENYETYLICCDVIANLYLLENGSSTLKEKTVYFSKANNGLEVLYSKYKIEEEVKFGNELFLEKLYEDNIKNHKQTPIEKFSETQTIIEAMPYQEKLDKIRRKKNDREGGGNIKDFLQWLDVYSAEVDF